jgi:hypothetical protein
MSGAAYAEFSRAVRAPLERALAGSVDGGQIDAMIERLYSAYPAPRARLQGAAPARE